MVGGLDGWWVGLSIGRSDRRVDWNGSQTVGRTIDESVGRTVGQMDGWMDGRTHEEVNGQMHKRMNGRTDGLNSIHVHISIFLLSCCRRY